MSDIARREAPALSNYGTVGSIFRLIPGPGGNIAAAWEIDTAGDWGIRGNDAVGEFGEVESPGAKQQVKIFSCAGRRLASRHLILYFDPIQACNLRCGMCHFSDDKWLEKHPVKRFSDSEIRRLADMFFPLAVQLHIGGSMEPTLYKGYPCLVTLGKQHKIPFISLTTNGQLLRNRVFYS